MPTQKQNVPIYLDAREWAVLKAAATVAGKPLATWIKLRALEAARRVVKGRELHAFGRPCGRSTGVEPTTNAIGVEKLTCPECRRILEDDA